MTAQRKRRSPLAGLVRIPVPIKEATIEVAPGKWTGRSEADLLRGYLEALEGKLNYVRGSRDALPESVDMAEAALGDLAQAQHFVGTLSPSQPDEVWNCMRLVMLAESVATNELHARAAQSGSDQVLGGREGAARRWPNIEARKQFARERYESYRAKSPNASRKKLCFDVGKELGVTPKTIAAWVPNPNRERRGRPKKN